MDGTSFVRLKRDDYKIANIKIVIKREIVDLLTHRTGHKNGTNCIRKYTIL